MTKPAKRHHLIPKFYLEAFASKGKILVQELGGVLYTSSTRKAFVVNDFYNTSDSGSNPSLEFENHLGKLEANAATALRRLRNREVLDIEEKATIAEFLLAQWVRGEDFRDHSKSFNNLAIRDMARESSESDLRLFHELSFGRLVTDDEWSSLWARYTSEYGPGFENTVANSFSQLKGLTSEAKKTLLLMRTWKVLDFSVPLLLSGDRPVVLSGLTRTPESVLGPGLAKAEQIVFPMSRSMALVLELGSPGQRPDEIKNELQSIHWVKADQSQGDAINQLIALNSMEKLFGHPDDKEQLKRLGTSLDPISNWVVASDWSRATDRLTEIKDVAVEVFKGMPRNELAQIISDSRDGGGNTDFFLREATSCD